MKKLALLFVLAVGALTAFAGRPIAMWDVVPYQKLEGPFKIGVVAFHERGAKVTFSVNGRKKWIAKRATLNPRTGVVEYVYTFDPTKYEDGPVTITAAVSVEGLPDYKLPELPLYVNAQKSLDADTTSVWVDEANGIDYNEGGEEAPVKTVKRAVQIAGDGGTIYLKPGSYTIKQMGGGLERKYWTTVTTAPGTDRASVKVLGGRLGSDKMKIAGLDIHTDAAGDDSRAIAVGESGQTMVWFDGCSFTNTKGRDNGVSRPVANNIRAFITGGVTHDMMYGPTGEIVRNHTVRDVAASALSGGKTLIANCTVSGVDAQGARLVDAVVYQGYATHPEWVEDVIVYNVKATECAGSALLTRQLKNAAFVDVTFAPAEGCEALSTFQEGLENVVFARVDVGAQPWWWYKALKKVGNVQPSDVRLFGVKTSEFRDGAPTMDIKISEENGENFPKGAK